MEDLTRRHSPLPPKEEKSEPDGVWVIRNAAGTLHSIWATELGALRKANEMSGFSATFIEFGSALKMPSTNYFDR